MQLNSEAAQNNETTQESLSFAEKMAHLRKLLQERQEKLESLAVKTGVFRQNTEQILDNAILTRQEAIKKWSQAKIYVNELALAAEEKVKNLDNGLSKYENKKADHQQKMYFQHAQYVLQACERYEAAIQFADAFQPKKEKNKMAKPAFIKEQRKKLNDILLKVKECIFKYIAPELQASNEEFTSQVAKPASPAIEGKNELRQRKSYNIQEDSLEVNTQQSLASKEYNVISTQQNTREESLPAWVNTEAYKNLNNYADKLKSATKFSVRFCSVPDQEARYRGQAIESLLVNLNSKTDAKEAVTLLDHAAKYIKDDDNQHNFTTRRNWWDPRTTQSVKYIEALREEIATHFKSSVHFRMN